MPNPRMPLEPGNYYHVYNRGINSCNLFREDDNYKYFLKLYEKYIPPVANTFAWVFMGNHFHLLVQILPKLHPEGIQNLQGVAADAEKHVIQQFSNLFNAYTKAFNKRYNRTGTLFEHPFRRKLISDHDSLKQVVLYIHNNPVRHGFCSHPAEYTWSSYLSFVSEAPTILCREAVLGWFGNEANFKYLSDPEGFQNLQGLNQPVE